MSAPPAGGSVRSSGTLLKVLGLWFGLAAIVGNTIGAGIMRTPSEVAAALPSTAGYLAAWLIGGLYAALGAASIAELGVMMPKSGGQYVFARETFGPYMGFVLGWSDWISTAASAAAVSMVLAEYATGFGGRAGSASSLVVVAGAAVALFTALQWRGVRSGDRVQQVTTLLKTVALLGVPVVAFLTGTRTESASVEVTGAVTAAGLVLVLQSVIYAYDGWTGVLYFSEEVTDPARDIPRSMLGGVLAIVAIYLLLAGSFIYVLGPAGVAADTFPAGAVARVLFGDAGDTVIRVIMIVSLVSALNAILMMGSRVPYGMSRDGLFPRAAARVNPGGTPVVTLLITSLLAIGFLLTGTFTQVIGIAAFFFVLMQVVSFTAVFVLRRRQPDRPRPYRAIGYPVTTALSLLGGLSFLLAVIIQDRRNSLIAIGILVASYPVFRLSGLPRTE